MANRISRRRALQTCSIGLTAVLAGCISAPGERGASPDTERPDEDANGKASVSCPLNHDILEKDRAHGIRERYQYDSLSATAQHHFEKALEVGVRYQNESTEGAPPEFEYTDVVSKYEITYEGETYILGTWSGDGCSINT